MPNIFPTSPVIVTVAPNGARKTKTQHPNIPLTAQELGAEAKACYEAGAAMIHLHVRKPDASHSLEITHYQEAIAEIRKQAGEDLIIQVTTEAVGIYTPDQQMAVIDALKPEAASFAVRELIPTPEAEPVAKAFFHRIIKEGVFPQYILYSPKEASYFASLLIRNIIPNHQPFVLFVLGKKPTHATDNPGYAVPEDLDPFLEIYRNELAPRGVTWAICAFGGNELACVEYAVKNGGHARIGFENNHLLADGSIAPSNAALIAQFSKALAGQSPARTASADEVREEFGVGNQEDILTAKKWLGMV